MQPEPQVRAVRWRTTYASGLAFAPASGRSDPLPRTKNWLLLVSLGAWGARLPQQGLRRGGVPGLGPAPRGGGGGPVPTPPRSWVSKQRCVRWSPSDWIGRAQEEPARVCPALSAPCRVVGGTAPLGSRTGRWPVVVARSGNYISSSGRRRDTGRGESFCDQVRAGEAGGGAAAPRAYSRSPRPRPELPRATDWPECGPRPVGAGLRGAGLRRGRATGAPRSGFCGPRRLALYVNSGGSAPCSPRWR